MIIAPLQTTIASNILLEEGVQQVDFPEGRIRLSEVTGRVVSKENNVATVDRSLIQYPFLLRKWKAGDYFYPFGMKKKKKLSRFFIDRKLSVTDKEKVWVIEANKKIIWVIGHRIDERFRVTDNTPSTLKFQFVPQRDLK
jgi:tRNA(Ile)-lysidine synthase